MFLVSNFSKYTSAILGIYYYKFRTRHVKHVHFISLTAVLFTTKRYILPVFQRSLDDGRTIEPTCPHGNVHVKSFMLLFFLFLCRSSIYIYIYIYLYIHIYTHIPAVAYMRMNLSKPSWSLAYQFEHQYMKWTIDCTGRWFCWPE